jgi:hypothetical protein
MITARVLTVIAPTVELRLADMTDRSVLGRFGIAGDVSAGADYAPTQEWSLRLWDAGFDGIYYAARHDPQFTERSVALFGAPGDQTASERKRFDVASAAISDDVLAELLTYYGIVLVPAAGLTDDAGDR